jgi:ribosomal protein S6--L-glutamate ligase
MKLMVIGSPSTFESQAILNAALTRGHEAFASSGHDFYFEIKDTGFKAFHRTEDLMSFDTFLFRGITSSKPEESNLYNFLVLAKYLYENGKTIVDEKLATDQYIASKISYSLSKNNIPVPNTVLTFGRNISKDYLKTATYPLIIKSTTGSKGRGVFLANNMPEALKIIDENEAKRFMFQEYIPTRFDIRVFVIGDKVLGAMRRDAADGDFRSNIAQGGTATIFDLTKDARIAQLALDSCKAMHVEIAGVDIMINEENLYVLEVNRSPQFHGFADATGLDVGGEIVKYIEGKKK